MMIFSALGRSAPIYVSGQLRGYAGTSSTWSMSRLWNNLKKGIGADKPVHAPKPTAAQVPIKEASPALKKTPNAIVENKLAEAKAATPMGGTDFLWQPKPTTISRAEIQRFEVETPMFRCSPQKLADLGRQLTGLPLDAAIIQAQFSAKRPAMELFKTLSQAQANAVQRGKAPSDYIIKEAVTGRGKYMKRLDIKGRGRCGIIRKPHAFMRLVLELPDARKDIAKLLRVKTYQRENKPPYIKLDY